MRVAVIGGGISGLTAASKLHASGYQVTLFEESDEIGGHVKTLRVPIENGIFPIDLGVFMFDPQYIHPKMGEQIKKFGISFKEFELSFSFVDKLNHLQWTSQSKFPSFFKGASIFLSGLKQDLLSGKISQNSTFFIELILFLKKLPILSFDSSLSEASLKDYMEREKPSNFFVENWLLPQMLCWWGITKEHAYNSSIQVIFQSMYYVLIAPNQCMFDEGWDCFIKKVAEPIEKVIRKNSPIRKVLKEDRGGVSLSLDERTEYYDAVIFATPPNITSKLLQDKTIEEEKILSSFLTTTTTVYAHQDCRWLPENVPWSIINNIQDDRGSFCTFWCGGLSPLKPSLFITWGDDMKEIPDKVLETRQWLRTLPTVEYVTACREIKTLQGLSNIWHCGAHVDCIDEIPSLWHENAYRSGIMVAEKIIEKQKG